MTEMQAQVLDEGVEKLMLVWVGDGEEVFGRVDDFVSL